MKSYPVPGDAEKFTAISGDATVLTWTFKALQEFEILKGGTEIGTFDGGDVTTTTQDLAGNDHRGGPRHF